jgi:eukaryotic-like serine/threonine-protein kinase
VSRFDNIVQLRSGDTLGGYQLLMAVGSGGMGRVWAARRTDTPTQSIVALKTALEEMARDEQFERMLLDEARIAASIIHPNVCAIREVGAENGIPYLVMDWMDAGTLLDVLVASADRRIDCFLAVRILSDVAAGLHAAHELTGPDGNLLNVVHRDVSPQNVLLSSAGHVKVADFGVAKARGQLHAPTETGEVKGKLSYMAPEQLTSKVFDRRADIFALGCCLYEATTGERPFHGADALETMYRLLETDCVLPSAIVEDYPKDLEAIVLRTLAKDPENRYRTADDVRSALEGFLAQNGRLVTDRDVSALVRSVLASSLEAKARALQQATQAILNSKPGTLKTGPEVTRPRVGQTGNTPHTWNTNPPGDPKRRRNRTVMVGAATAALLGVLVWFQGRNSPAVATRSATNSSSAQAATPAPPVTATLRAEPIGATIRIDDGPSLTSPQVIVTMPSQQLHRVVVSLDGYDPLTRQVVFDHDQEIVVGLKQRPPEPPEVGAFHPAKSVKSLSQEPKNGAAHPQVAAPGDLPSTKRKRPKRTIDPDNPYAEP